MNCHNSCCRVNSEKCTVQPLTPQIGKSMLSVWLPSTPARKEKVWTKAIFIYFIWELFALNKYKNSWIRGKVINIADYAGYLGEVFLFCGYKKTITYGISLVLFWF